jgi:uncharacterized delta-60 repeat protein
MEFSVSAVGMPTLAYQWFKNGAAIADATNSGFVIQSSSSSDAGSYLVVVTNGFGAVTSVVATLTLLNPVLPDAFNPGVSGGTSPAVYALARQSDGKVMVGGSFTKLAGQTRFALGRVDANGKLDIGFHPGVPSGLDNPSVYCLALQGDGRVLVGGNFNAGYGTGNYLFRLNADDSWDQTFILNPNGAVYCVSVQADGKILVGGSFSTLDGMHYRACMGRLNADGSLDSTFNPEVYYGPVYTVTVQADGKILVGGTFSMLGGQSRSSLGRLNADGMVDTTFDPGANGAVYSLAVQADSKILVGGSFTTLGGQSRSCLGRLNADGGVDPNFSLSANGSVYSLVVQTDGKILVGGSFTTLGGQSRSHLGRINADGSVDSTFNPGANSYVYSLTVQPGGEVLVGGTFTTLGGQTRNYLGRLSNTQAATENLSFDGSTVTWLRGATSPEVWRVSFEACTNGTDWTNLDSVARIPGGWQQTGLSLPTYATIRARGFCAGGAYNGSGWFLESSIGAPAITFQPTNAAFFTNTVMGFSVVTIGTPPFAYQWYKNGALIADATNSAFTISNSAWSDVGVYQVVVTNGFGAVTSAVATLKILNPPVPDSFNPGANQGIYTCFPQPDGKVIVGGSFTILGGQPRNYLGRLNSDGTLDQGFNPGASGEVYALAVQPDGKIVVGGLFTSMAGQPRKDLARLNPDGTLDATFNPGANNYISCLVLQPDGGILVGGNFTTLGGQSCSNLGRLSIDGNLDTGFNPGPDDGVNALALQPDGKMVVGGYFTTLGGEPRQCIGRLNANGSVDMSFNPGSNIGVHSLAMQADGKILVGGTFDTLGGLPCSRIGRLNSNGTLDTAFYPWASDAVECIAIQTDGKILLSGYFTALCSQTRLNLGRLNSDGTLDPTFNPGTGGPYAGGGFSLALQTDGKVLVAGGFGTIGGQSRSCIARLVNSEPATETLIFTNSTVTWLRTGTGQGVWCTTFEASTNGADWVSLGDGTVISGGWQATGVTIATNATIRARGFVGSGHHNGSSWFVETGLGPAAISRHPTSRTNNAGNAAEFVVMGVGTPLLSYQWCKGGIPLSDSGNVSGSQTATLTLTNVLGGDAGSYSVIITNNSGSVTSQVATLSVVDPFINTQPVSQTVNADSTVLFSATAAGTESLGYQWRRNGLSVAGATGLSLTLTNVQWADAGGFDLLVSNRFGAITSVVSTLSVNGPVIPVNDGSFGLHTNGFGFNVGCMPGEAVVIEASTNLVDWVPVQTNLVTSEGIFLFVDLDKGTYSRRFYRARLYAGALPAPAIGLATGVLVFPTDPFGFNLWGVAGQTVVIEASTNLAKWVPLATNRLGTDPLYYSDPASTNLSQRFYRAVLVP